MPCNQTFLICFTSFDFIHFLHLLHYRKYNLRKVMVNGDIPPRVKKDAQAVILEFIRSRPPLRKVSTHLFYHFEQFIFLHFFHVFCWYCVTNSFECRFSLPPQLTDDVFLVFLLFHYYSVVCFINNNQHPGN